MPDYFDNRVTISVSVYGSVRASVILMVICYAAPCSRFVGPTITASMERENFFGRRKYGYMPPSRIVEKAPLYRQTYRGVGYTS